MVALVAWLHVRELWKDGGKQGYALTDASKTSPKIHLQSPFSHRSPDRIGMTGRVLNGGPVGLERLHSKRSMLGLSPVAASGSRAITAVYTNWGRRS
jgi:hypothetical protein